MKVHPSFEQPAWKRVMNLLKKCDAWNTVREEHRQPLNCSQQTKKKKTSARNYRTYCTSCFETLPHIILYHTIC